jgi:hypothetical protein
MSAYACQLIHDAFVRFPYPERSSAKSSCRQVNGSFSAPNPYIYEEKYQWDAVAADCAAAVPALRKR